MSSLICHKCNTNNVADALKCTNCGFPFSKKKMETMEKFIGDIQHKATIVETLNPVETEGTGEKDTFLTSKNPNQGFHYPENSVEHNHVDSEDMSEMSSYSEPTQGNKLHFDASDQAGDSNVLHSETMLFSEIESNPAPENNKQEVPVGFEETGSCKKCGYILSDFSSLCPNCGHNNVPVSVTVRMPDKTQILDTGIQQEDITREKEQNITGSYPDFRNKTEMYTPKGNFSGENNKTIAQKDEDNVTSNDKNVNVTIRENFNNLNSYNDNFDIPASGVVESNEIKSKVRLEAIFLGQDSGQKMVVNIPDNDSGISLNREMIDDEDNTISGDQHALIFKDENSWKIKNMASNKAVFIQVNDTSTLKNGDIIMLGGDKFYLFLDESQE